MVLALCVLAEAPFADAQGPVVETHTVSDVATVIDADSIIIKGTNIRLQGIDAPEIKQLCRRGGGVNWGCGKLADAALRDKLGNKVVTCSWTKQDKYGRALGTCYLGSENINAWIVAEGWALAYRQYSTVYVVVEENAQAAGKGIWRGDFVAPWEWRRGKRLP